MRADDLVTALAERFHMTLTGMRKHIGVLEQAQLVSTQKAGGCAAAPWAGAWFEDEAAWIDNYRRLWAARFDALDTVIEQLKRKEPRDGRRQRK